MSKRSKIDNMSVTSFRRNYAEALRNAALGPLALTRKGVVEGYYIAESNCKTNVEILKAYCDTRHISSFSNEESEVIAIKRAWDIINDVVNYNNFIDKYWDDNRYLFYRDGGSYKLFYVLYLEFIRSMDVRMTGLSSTFVEYILNENSSWVFGKENSVLLCEAVKKYDDVTSNVVDVDVYFPDIDYSGNMSLSVNKFMKLYGNTLKHDVHGLSVCVRDLMRIMKKSGREIVFESEGYKALSNFKEYFNENRCFDSVGMYIVSLLNDVAHGIYWYAKNEFMRSYHKKPEISELCYGFKYPEYIKHEYSKFCYWELMNLVRHGPIIKSTFDVPQSFKKYDHLSFKPTKP